MYYLILINDYLFHLLCESLDKNLFMLLKDLRKKEANRISLPPSIIFSEPSIIEMSNIYDTMSILTPEERMTRFQLRPDRADVIVPAIDIYMRILNNFKASNIFVPKIGLSDGMVYQMFLEENLN